MKIISDKVQFEDTTYKIVLLVRLGVINLKLFVRAMVPVPALGFFMRFYMFGSVRCGSANRTLVDLFCLVWAEQ